MNAILHHFCLLGRAEMLHIPQTLSSRRGADSSSLVKVLSRNWVDIIIAIIPVVSHCFIFPPC